jgi:CheY-like chemotaxis protein
MSDRSMPSHHVLLVEDDQELRYALRKALTREGLRVTDVPSSHEALAKLEEADCDVEVLVTDVMLGSQGPHGISLTQMSRLKRPGLPVIFITGFPETLHHVEPHGPVLTKPVDPMILALRIRHEVLKPMDDQTCP